MGLIDTGAAVTIIGAKVARHLEACGVSSRPMSSTVRLANGGKVASVKAYSFEGTLHGKTCQFEAIYLPSITSDLVLGMDSIDRLNMVHFNVDTERVANNDKPRDTQVQWVSAVANLSEGQKCKLEKFLQTELALCAKSDGRTTVLEHEIRLKPGVIPIKQRYYPRNPAMQEVIDKEVKRMLEEDVIEPSNSAWSSPVVLIKKPTGKYRFCIDFRQVNNCSEKDAYPLPRINAILEKLRAAKYITTLDLADGYWQVPLADKSRPVTAFTVPGLGLFQFKVTPFGLHSAGATFQRLLDHVVGPALEPYAFAYLDDLILTSETFDRHLDLLREVLSRLRTAGLKLNVDKCHFCQTEMKYLGHVVNADGISTDPDKVKAILEFPRPTKVKTLRSFLGLASWYRRFVDKFARITAPLTVLLKKNVRWKWEAEQENAFLELKRRLTTTPILACPDFNKTFSLQVDASNEGLGVALTQKEESKEVVIGYASRSLSESEKKFTVTEKECLALVWAVKKFRPYLEGYHFIAVTDHIALNSLLRLKEPSGRLARWVLELQQFDFEVKYRKGTSNKVADALSRHPVEEAPQSEYVGDTENYPRVDALEREPEERLDMTGEDADPWYNRLLMQLRDGRRVRGRFTFRANKIYKYHTRRTRDGIDSGRWVLCVPRRERGGVLRETHDADTAGHFGFKKTARRLSEGYYWPGWRRELRKYIRSCPICQRYKVEQAKPAGIMHFRPPGGPWHTVSADLLGPLPRSKKGNKYVIAFQDEFSKWTELAPLKAATAASVALKFKEHVLLRYGAPDVLITDNGTQFCSKEFRDMAREWGIEFKYSAPYSPQSNPIERRNRVIKTLIAQSIKGTHATWDVRLKEIAYAINTATHDATQRTPAMLCYGRELRAPMALRGPLFVEGRNEDPPTTRETHESRMGEFSKLYRSTQRNLKAAYDRSAKSYNLRRRDVQYEVGQEVLRRTRVLSSAADAIASKLAPKYEGPFVIDGKTGYNIYQLREPGSGKKSTVHVKDLKPYVRRECADGGLHMS